MAWRAAKSLIKLQDAINARYPKDRDKSLDAFRASPEHRRRSPNSDHNENSKGVVCAYDITRDLARGVDVHALADYMRLHMDPRVQYIISNGRICNPDREGGRWRPYTQSNKHVAHIHVSVRQKEILWGDESPWDLGEIDVTPIRPTGGPYPDFLRRGSLGDDVEVLQWLIRTKVDGDFGPNTDAAVRAFQRKAALEVDGIVGHKTWEKIRDYVSPPEEPPLPPPPIVEPIPVARFRTEGKMSTFGGPLDRGVAATEGLALYNTAEEAGAHGVRMLSTVEAGAPGLARRLDPTQYYIACRWDYQLTPRSFLQGTVARVSNKAGQTVMAKPVDWGPHERTGRVADLSPALATALGLDTDDIVKVEI